MPPDPIRSQQSDRLFDRGNPIRELLLTWQVRQMRGAVFVPPPADDGRDDPEWSWKYEQRYGAPKLDQREEVLRIALDVLSHGGRKDLGPIVAALHRIKAEAFEAARDGLTIDLQREHLKEADMIRRNLTEWLPRAIRLHERLNPDDLPAGRRLRQMYEEMLRALTFDERMTDQERALRDWVFDPSLLEKVPLRRAKQTNPDAQLVKYAHELLSDAGVPREQHRDLLWAIGLMDENGIPGIR